MNETLLITGGSGLLALNWAQCVKSRNKTVLALHNRKISLSGVDTKVIYLDKISTVQEAINSFRPSYVIHTAGLTDVEQCESDLSMARESNATLALNVAIACNREHVPLVHISTDHLFDGSKQMATEDQVVVPLNNYALTKYEAENHIKEVCPKALIIRTNFFGWGPHYRRSFSDFILDNLTLNREITLFNDVYYTPIFMDNLILLVERLCEERETGVYNIVGNERISKYEFGLMLAKKFRLKSALIKSGSISNYNSLATRPKDMSLSNAKVKGRLECQIDSLDDQIDVLYRRKNDPLIREIVNL